jgi:DNA-directed RNA polymerase specialized sigma24 family protein
VATPLSAVPQNRLSEIDWGLLLERLLGRSIFMTHRAPHVFDGVSAEDVVNDALAEFFADKNQLGWDPKVGPLEPFLWTVVKRKILNHLRRARYVGVLEEERTRQLSDTSSLASDPEHDFAVLEQLEYLKKFASGDKELERLLEVAARVDGPNINQEIAESLRTTAATVARLKRKLQRRVRAGRKEATSDGKSV